MTQRDDALDKLRAAGFELEMLSDEQHEVLRDLTEDELALLLDIKGRLADVAPEVQAHSDIAGGALF
ncbi:aroma-sacti cluster domain-containing protein [Wenjunlia tyrosinilytica]|uniref:Uncharacterized protein n=1 Tax=Wenjunlia tyrosinilytica TaxID=1544741 RepID=A0A917ZZD2_9ACTN|nr:aroma-sacti cluster domain-containing protein [Wenjunlia tyrosinilytica]GGO99998.1 hypothetical protein GCM10012280_67720 [Wenjunlia tyrosinilytica]